MFEFKGYSGNDLHRFPGDYDLRDGVFFPRGSLEDASSVASSEVEDCILKLISGAEDRSLFSGELLAGVHNWQTLLKLSPRRSNLLRPFAQQLKGKVLEEQGGWGVITRFLGENGADVVALEDDPRRAQIASERTTDLDNVRIVCDRIEMFASDEKFDAIVAIDAFDQNESPIPKRSAGDLLCQLRDLLAPHGVIILAVENKLGLKYLAGARDHRTGVPFDGINNVYRRRVGPLFGGKELSALLDDNGLASRAVFYPTPSHRMATTVLSSRALTAYPDLAASLFSQTVREDPQRPAEPTFSLEQGWCVAGQNGLLEDLANSYLVVAGATQEAIAPYDSSKSIAWHYSIRRHKAFVKETRFVEGDDDLVVERHLLETCSLPIVPMRQLLEREVYCQGQNWWNNLVEVLNRPGWSVVHVADWARVWIDALLHECRIDVLSGDTFTKHVDGRYFDLTPFNMIRDQAGEAHFFDREWYLKPSIELGYLVVRGLRDSLKRMGSCAPAETSTPYGVNQLILRVLAELGVFSTAPDIDRYQTMERQVQAWVQGKAEDQIDLESVKPEWNVYLKPRLYSDSRKSERAREALQRDLEKAQFDLEQSEEVRNSLSEELKQQTVTVADLEAKNDVLRRTLAEHDSQFRKLRNELEEKAEESKRRDEEARAAIARIRNAEALVKQQAGQIAGLEANVGERFRELATLTGILKEKEPPAVSKRPAVKSPSVRASFPRGGGTLREKASKLPKALKKRLRLKRDRRLVAASNLFDGGWYLEQNPDVLAAGVDPLNHFLLYGGAEGRAPSPKFDSNAYLRANADVAAAGVNPLVHYLAHGRQEGRKYVAVHR